MGWKAVKTGIHLADCFWESFCRPGLVEPTFIVIEKSIIFISPNNSLDTVIFNPRNTHYQQKWLSRTCRGLVMILISGKNCTWFKLAETAADVFVIWIKSPVQINCRIQTLQDTQSGQLYSQRSAKSPLGPTCFQHFTWKLILLPPSRLPPNNQGDWPDFTLELFNIISLYKFKGNRLLVLLCLFLAGLHVLHCKHIRIHPVIPFLLHLSSIYHNF